MNHHEDAPAAPADRPARLSMSADGKLCCSGAWTLSVDCSPNPCDQPTGSCCTPAGACTVTTDAACEAPSSWQLDQFWIIDYRIYDPEGDGKTKLDHVQDMLLNCVHQKELQFWAVLMDSWYATKEIMLTIEKYEKIYYCPFKDNRQVDDSNASQPYRRGIHWCGRKRRNSTAK